MFILVGFLIFGLYQVSLPADKRTILDLKSAWWILPWLGALLVLLVELPSLDGNPTKVFGLNFVSTKRIGNWYDLLAVAAMSLVVFYIATFNPLSHSYGDQHFATHAQPLGGGGADGNDVRVAFAVWRWVVEQELIVKTTGRGQRQ